MVWASLITQQHCAGTGACHTTEEEEEERVMWSMFLPTQSWDMWGYQACTMLAHRHVKPGDEARSLVVCSVYVSNHIQSTHLCCSRSCCSVLLYTLLCQ